VVLGAPFDGIKLPVELFVFVQKAHSTAKIHTATLYLLLMAWELIGFPAF
jgi:hypothetical protein